MSGTIRAIYDTFEVERFPLPSEEQVSDLESRLKSSLPPRYREFILGFNGGYFTEPYPYIPVSHEECPSDRLTDLWGIGAAHQAAELGHDTDLFDDNEPPVILPIGYTERGNLLFLDTEESPDCDEVFLKLAYSSTVIYIADNVDEFFGLLRHDRPT
jgi:hypothetical protein